MKSLVILITAIFIIQTSIVFAQENPQPQQNQAQLPKGPLKPPVMKSVFWNTLMGSAWGALIGVSVALGDERGELGNFREIVISFTTLGGLVGYGFGVYLIIRGITFDRNVIPALQTTPLTKNITPNKFNNQIPYFEDPTLFSFEKTQNSAFKWKTVVYQTKF